MAAAPRLFLSTILRKPNVVQQWKTLAKLPALNIVRYSNYLSSPPVRDINEYPEVEVVQNPAEWKYVERLLPALTVPKPKVQSEYASGWTHPLQVDIEKHKYFVARTKNHMVPVYLHRTFRGQRRLTIVRLIHGDIWKLETDLRSVVERARNGKICATRVNEMSGQIHIHGDYVDVVREYLKERGF